MKTLIFAQPALKAELQIFSVWFLRSLWFLDLKEASEPKSICFITVEKLLAGASRRLLKHDITHPKVSLVLRKSKHGSSMCI